MFDKITKKNSYAYKYGLYNEYEVDNVYRIYFFTFTFFYAELISFSIEAGNTINRETINFWLTLINLECFLIYNHLCKYNKTG